MTFADQLGSSTFTIDHATSELVEYTTYTSYGQTESDYRTERWDNHRESRRFTGKEEDIEVGLNYHGARYYSPALKRWMSADPVTIHKAGSDINPWAYGYGNPTSFVDPDGREPISLTVIGVTILVAAVVAGGTSATVQYAQTGHVNWGMKGVAGAAIAGAVGAAVGMGVGGLASGLLGPTAAGALGGAAGGASSGALGTRLATGSWNGVGKAALTGAVSGAVGGAVGVLAGSQSGGLTGFGGTMAGTGAGTAAGVGFGAAAWGDDVSWQSLGMSFSTAFAGSIASYGLSKGWSEVTENKTAGRAAEASGKTSSGDPAPCGTGGNPACGNAGQRESKMSSLQRQIDGLVKDWRNSPSPLDPAGKETILDSTVSSNPRHRLELTAGIVVNENGEARLTRTFIGDLDSSEVNWDKAGIKPGDQLVGTVHTHPGGAGAENFSKGDIAFGKDFLAQVKGQPGAMNPKVGVQIYVVQPKDAGGGILNFDVRRNLITSVR